MRRHRPGEALGNRRALRPVGPLGGCVGEADLQLRPLGGGFGPRGEREGLLKGVDGLLVVARGAKPLTLKVAGLALCGAGAADFVSGLRGVGGLGGVLSRAAELPLPEVRQRPVHEARARVGPHRRHEQRDLRAQSGRVHLLALGHAGQGPIPDLVGGELEVLQFALQACVGIGDGLDGTAPGVRVRLHLLQTRRVDRGLLVCRGSLAGHTHARGEGDGRGRAQAQPPPERPRGAGEVSSQAFDALLERAPAFLDGCGGLRRVRSIAEREQGISNRLAAGLQVAAGGRDEGDVAGVGGHR